MATISLTLQKLVNVTNILFHMMDIQPYAMVLPMDGKSATKNKKKIMSKIINNKSNFNQDSRDLLLAADDPQSPFYHVNNFIDRIDSEGIVGCMILLAKRQDPSLGVVPLAGGIIEMFDEHERCIQAIWTNAKLDDSINAKILLNGLVLRLCAHAYQMDLPDTKRGSHPSKLVSVYQAMGQTFPKDAFDFLLDRMKLSKHYESFAYTGKHSDSEKTVCRCTRLADAENTHMFYGISETRFTSLYSSSYEPLVMEAIAQVTPAPKGQSPKAQSVHIKDHVSKTVAEIERSLKNGTGILGYSVTAGMGLGDGGISRTRASARGLIKRTPATTTSTSTIPRSANVGKRQRVVRAHLTYTH